MISTRRTLNFTAPLVLDPPSHSGVFSVALVPGRHLIGSAADCDIRLNFAGIAARHAIVMVGENRTIIKSMDSRTWVNDSPVTEMALRSGDRLSVGPVTFRVRAATKDELADFEVGSEGTAQQVHRVDVPAMMSESGSATVSDRVASPDAAKPGSITDSVLSVIEALPVSATAIEVPSLPVAPIQLSPPGPVEVRANDSIDDRLGAIQQRLAELEFNNSPVRQSHEPSSAEIDRWAQSLQSREQELLRRVEQIAIDTEHLYERSAQLATRETHLDAREQQLGGEAKRIAEIAESTRRSLAEEHAQHLAIWKEWEVAYQRMASEVAEQTEAINRQREALQAEADRLSLGRTEIQRARVVHDQHRKELDEDHAALAKERAEILALKSRFEVQRQQHHSEVAEQRRQIDAAKRELDLRRAEFDTSLQQLDHERQLILADRSDQVRRAEQDNQRRVSLYAAVEADRERLRIEREEFALAQVSFEQRRATFEREITIARSVIVASEPVVTEVDPVVVSNALRGSASVELGGGASIDSGSSTAKNVSEEPASMTSISGEITTPRDDEGLAAELCQKRYDTFDAWTVPLQSHDVANEVQLSSSPLPPPLPPMDLIAVDLQDVLPPSVGSAFPELDNHAKLASREPEADHWDSVTRSQAADQNIWESPSSFVQGAGAAVSLTSPSPTEFTPPTTGIDPWGSFAPTTSHSMDSSVVPTSHSNAEMTAFQIQGTGASLDESATESASSPFDLVDDPKLNVDETLAVVNREFGVPVEEPDTSQPTTALPSWWVENTKPTAVREDAFQVDKPGWIAEALKEETQEGAQGATPAADPADDLRSKLAMLFDLPTDAGAIASGPSEQEEEVASDQAIAPIEEVDTNTVPDGHSGIQDSVDEFMARLLARSRGEDAAPPPLAKETSSSPAVDDAVSFTLPAETDRSHLMEGPKHKQDKQAVRENLKSFRKVAHLSARSALARHSLQQLRNATIAKGILLGVSSAAMLWFFTRPLFGAEFQMWKAGGCGLAALLAAVEFHRSWSQLFKPITAPVPPKAAVVDHADVMPADAAIDVTVDAPPTPTESVVEHPPEA
eukprot:TRINITY_DN271_c0_g1_i10.p1 TRINITY_DN271_c0_g1~~TRINITY_DN271_c0_g1_i10.p1  ORF type:complete len:1077 (+),score=227.45 TRINITY_DN271_c0_g1_i10:6766-9996(+)